MLSFQADHEMSAEEVKKKLVDNVDFRIRLSFEMGDEDVVNEGRNLNFRPRIPEIPEKARIFQSSELKWVGQDVILITRFMFSIAGRFVRVESTRRIVPIGPRESKSLITAELKSSEASDVASKAALTFIKSRHEKENVLIKLSMSSQIALPGQFALPYDQKLADIRDVMQQLDLFLISGSSIDPLVIETATELRKLHKTVRKSASEILTALRVRDELQQQVKAQSREVGEAAAELEGAIMMRDDLPGVSDSGNDIVFALGLVPLVFAVLGFVFGKRKKS
jgi:hypothetical protein